jgi:hypothetical protein
MMDEPPEETRRHDWRRREELLHRARVSTLYHRARERTYDAADRWSKIVALVSGSLAFSRIVGEEGQQLVLAAVAISSAASVVFGFAGRARQHAELAAKWLALEADIEREGQYDFAAKLDRWAARRAEIEAGEPPQSDALVRKVQNRIFVAEGKLGDIQEQSLLSRLRTWLFG